MAAARHGAMLARQRVAMPARQHGAMLARQRGTMTARRRGANGALRLHIYRRPLPQKGIHNAQLTPERHPPRLLTVLR